MSLDDDIYNDEVGSVSEAMDEEAATETSTAASEANEAKDSKYYKTTLCQFYLQERNKFELTIQS
jgi:hypothetical protein